MADNIRKEVGKKIRRLLKENNIKATYRTESSISFDYVLSIDGDNKDYEAVRKIVRENNLSYSDPENDLMTDYFGCHNSLVLFNGRGC